MEAMIIYRKSGATSRVATVFQTPTGMAYSAFVGKRGGMLRKYKSLDPLDEAMAKIGFKRDGEANGS
jgi:hypothetical protein